MITLVAALTIAGKALALLAALASALGTVRNTLHQLGWYTPSEDAKFGKVLDVMALISEKGKKGLAGVLSLPGFASRSTDLKIPDDVEPPKPNNLRIIPLLLAGLLACQGCLLKGEPKTDTTAQRLAADVAASKVVMADVSAQCGDKYVSIAPLVMGLLSSGGNPAALVATLLGSAPAIYSDVQALICAIRVIEADYKKLAPAKSAEASSRADALVAEIERLATPPDAGVEASK